MTDNPPSEDRSVRGNDINPETIGGREKVKQAKVGAFDADSVSTDISRTEVEPVVNVKSFGAVGDGTTDDTQAIKDAVNAASDADTVFFPPGEYLISDFIGFSGRDVEMGRPRIDSDGNITGAYLKLANGSDVSPVVRHASASDFSGRVHVDANRSNQSVNITAVEIDSARTSEFTHGVVNADTAVSVIDESENNDISVFASESGTALHDHNGTNDENEFTVHAHSIETAFHGDGGRSKVNVLGEQLSGTGILLEGGLYTIMSPVIRPSETALEVTGGEHSINGGYLSNNGGGFYCVSITGGNVDMSGTWIREETYGILAASDRVTLRGIYYRPTGGQRIVYSRDNCQTVLRSVRAMSGTGKGTTFKTGADGKLDAEIPASLALDSDFSLEIGGNDAQMVLRVETPITTTERDSLPTGSNVVWKIFNSTTGAPEWWDGSAWQTTQS